MAIMVFVITPLAKGVVTLAWLELTVLIPSDANACTM